MLKYREGVGGPLVRYDFAEVASACLDRAAADCVRHVELMFDPQAHTMRGVAIGTILEGLAKARSATRNGLSTSLIVNFMHERDEAEALDVLASLEPYRSQIVAVGIDSSEIGYPPQKFTQLFETARTMGFKLVAHAGFEGPPTDIEEAGDRGVISGPRREHVLLIDGALQRCLGASVIARYRCRIRPISKDGAFHH
ncbi:hypothetical protein ACF3M1_16830 [Luteimonas sp. WGS1318]|uniref:hypothetical protein n=1 Tax=Luteimonas sp. WGS1318 TaxID=3366815 RepID=UPI00372D353D